MAKSPTALAEVDPIGEDWIGPVEEAVRDDVLEVMSVHPASESLRQAAIRLAHLADRADAMYAASTLRELRAVLADLTAGAGDLEDLIGDLSTPYVSGRGDPSAPDTSA